MFRSCTLGLTVALCCSLGALSLRQPGKFFENLQASMVAPYAQKPHGIPASAFVDLETAKMDRAHAGLWKALQSANIVYEGLSFNDPPPTDLSIYANGRMLPWDSSERPGRVNPNRLVLSLRWELFKKVVDEGGKIQIYLKTPEGGHLEPSETFEPCHVNMTNPDCVEGGFAVAYFHLPENSLLSVHLSVHVPSKGEDMLHDWSIQTADAGSGDAQARILFLFMNHTEYEKTWLKKKSEMAAASDAEKYAAKELTIFDLPESGLSPDLETNGFEMDSSGILQKPLDDLMFDMEREDVQQDFTTNLVVSTKRDCYINTTDDIQNLSLEGDNITGGDCIKFYGMSGFHKQKLEGGKLLEIFTCNFPSGSFSRKPVDCSDTPVNYSKNLTPPLLIRYTTSTTHASNTSRAAAMQTGGSLALMAEDQRQAVWDQVRGKNFEVGDTSYKTVGDVEAIIEVMEWASKLSEVLIESVERASEKWWKEKTGTDTKGACFSMNFRHTRKGMAGLPIAHVDATSVHQWFKPDGAFQASTLKRFEDKLGMNVSEALTHTVVTFNEWVNAGSDPIVELPLTMLDTSTLEQEDLEHAWIQAGLDSMSLRWSPKQRWYYKELKRGEGYRFITSPHEGPGGTRYTGTPHSAFRFIRPENVTADRPRQSYEFRCLLIDPTWTSSTITIEGLPVEPTDSEEIVNDAAAAVMTGIMSTPEAVMESLVDKEDFQESVNKAEDLFND